MHGKRVRHDIFEQEATANARPPQTLSFIDFFTTGKAVGQSENLRERIEKELLSLSQQLGASESLLFSVEVAGKAGIQNPQCVCAQGSFHAGDEDILEQLGLAEQGLGRIARGQDRMQQDADEKFFYFLHEMRPFFPGDIVEKNRGGFLLVQRSVLYKSFKHEEIALIAVYASKVQSLFDDAVLRSVLDDPAFAGKVA